MVLICFVTFFSAIGDSLKILLQPELTPRPPVGIGKFCNWSVGKFVCNLFLLLFVLKAALLLAAVSLVGFVGADLRNRGELRCYAVVGGVLFSKPVCFQALFKMKKRHFSGGHGCSVPAP